MKMMKAAVYKRFNEPIEIMSVPMPRPSSPGSVIIQVMATGVCRSDWHGWKGHDDDIKTHGSLHPGARIERDRGRNRKVRQESQDW